MKTEVGAVCRRCKTGRVGADGYADDGRPQYRCGNCGDTYTYGHGGHDWDTRPRNLVRMDCGCPTCSKLREEGKPEYVRPYLSPVEMPGLVAMIKKMKRRKHG